LLVENVYELADGDVGVIAVHHVDVHAGNAEAVSIIANE